MCKNQIIDQDEYDIYVYGSELVISFLISLTLIFIIGLITNTLSQAIAFLTVFISLRRFTGGYHALTHFKCKIIMVTIYITVIVLANNVNLSMFYFPIAWVIGTVLILFLCPIENENKPILKQDKKRHRICALILYFIIMTIGLMVFNCCTVLGNTVFFSSVSVNVLMVIPLLKKDLLTKVK